MNKTVPKFSCLRLKHVSSFKEFASDTFVGLFQLPLILCFNFLLVKYLEGSNKY